MDDAQGDVGDPPHGRPEAVVTDGANPDEARRALLGLAGRRLEPLPPDLVVDHVLRIYRYDEAGWPVQRAAVEAVVRRLRSASRDGLVVARRPRGGRYGAFACRREGTRKARPYETRLVGVEPLDASCDCADFLRGGLGLCKHVLVVLVDLVRRGRLARMRRDAMRGNAPGRGQPPGVSTRLTWDPVRPMRGAGDDLARLRLRSRTRPRGRLGGCLAVADGSKNGSRGGVWAIRASHLRAPVRRRAAVEALLGWAQRHPDDTDPAVRALLHDERKRLAQAPRTDARTLDQSLRSMRRRLYPYQREGVAKLLHGGRLLLADDMGLGKTAQAIAACHVLYGTRCVRRGIVVAPASLRLQWEREWRAFTDVPVEVVEGSPQERAALYRRVRRGILVMGYEQLLRDLRHVLAWNPQIVVLDEAQRIKNWATKTAAAVKRIEAPYRLVLTGTPLENRLEELASIMDWVDDRALEPKWRLEPWHTTYADGGREVAGVRNLDVLRTRLAPVMLRRRRPEVLSQLPERTDTVVPVPLTEAQAEEHGTLDLPIARLMSIGRRRPLAQAEFLKLMQLLTTQRIISNGLAQLRFNEVWPSLRQLEHPDEALLSTLDAPKLQELRTLVDRLAVAQERKVVVFSQWRRMLTLAHWAVRPLLDAAGLRAAFFTGAESQKRRMQNVVDLHEDPTVRVLFATDAGGTGLNLQRAATCCINVDLPWNPAVLEQRIGRIHRLGQSQPIDVYNLVSEACIEERIAGIVSTKRAVFEGLFDGDSDEVLFDASGGFLSRLEHVVQPLELDVDEDDGADEDEDMWVCPDSVADVVNGEGAEAGAKDGSAPESVSGSPSNHSAAAPVELPDPERLSEAFAGLRVERTAEGGMRIDADPAAAATLGTLLEQLGRLVREASGQ